MVKRQVDKVHTASRAKACPQKYITWLREFTKGGLVKGVLQFMCYGYVCIAKPPFTKPPFVKSRMLHVTPKAECNRRLLGTHPIRKSAGGVLGAFQDSLGRLSYIYIYVYTYTYVYNIQMHLNIYTCVCTYIYIYTYICTYTIHTYIYTCIYISLSLYIYIYILLRCRRDPQVAKLDIPG